MAQQADIKPKKKISYKVLTGLIITLILIIVFGLIFFQYMFFKSKAEGIAVGYARAATSAYQMGRQIPDTIFEVDNYRVEIISTQPIGGQPFAVTVNVRDRYTNITHYTYNQSATGQPAATALPTVNPQ